MKNKYKRNGKNPPHSNHRLKTIQKKVCQNGYESLNDDEITFLSSEIEKNKISNEDIQLWILEFNEN